CSILLCGSKRLHSCEDCSEANTVYGLVMRGLSKPAHRCLEVALWFGRDEGIWCLGGVWVDLYLDRIGFGSGLECERQALLWDCAKEMLSIASPVGCMTLVCCWLFCSAGLAL
ncbi:hypothetical protein GOODEAATRI_020147, partial [Goodea atripinnis]